MRALKVFLFACLSTLSLFPAESVDLSSPNNEITFRLFPADSGWQWQVDFRGQPVIERSPLRFSLDGAELFSGARPGQVKRSEARETYPWRGVHSTATNHYRQAAIQVLHPHRSHALEIRAFDTGVAFRHLVDAGPDAAVPDENTIFSLPPESTVWSHDLGGHYEDVYQKRSAAGIEPGEWTAPPVTYKLLGNAGYASITEAALFNYPGMALQAEAGGKLKLGLGHKHPISYPFELRYTNDIQRVSQPASLKGKIETPWRVVLIGADLNALVNSDVVHNLCPPADKKLFPAGFNTDWIRPGRAVWRYLDGGDRSLEGMKEFSRLAGEIGFEHHIIEGFWQRWSPEELRDLVDYSRQHNVGIWLWKHSRDLRDPQSRAEFWERVRQSGAVGVKLDFFDHEALEVVALYELLLREAAENKLMVNFHGSNKPSGESRTYPNELIRESVRGMESSRLRDRAIHDANLPFTRFLVGHADYTPVHFGERRADTTWAHQVATAVVFTAPLLTYAAHPEKILANPALPLIKRIPAVWDETIVLPPSEIGEVAVLARRSGREWFLGIVNGPEARTIDVPLSFLGAGSFKTITVRDVPGKSDDLHLAESTHRKGATIEVKLEPGGGFVAAFSQQ